MKITSRTYDSTDLYGEDYEKVRAFLIKVQDINFSFARWDWMISHSHLQKDALPYITLWEDGKELVGIVTFDTKMDGQFFLSIQKGYEFLYKDMIAYIETIRYEGMNKRIFIPDGEDALQQTARMLGYVPTQEKDCIALFDIVSEQININMDSDCVEEKNNLAYQLPEGYHIVSIEDEFDMYQYGRVLWNGFNHELDGEGAYSPSAAELAGFEKEFNRPNVDKSLKIAVKAPDGNFAAYCGMWKDISLDIAVVEPVATDPKYRKLGLGKAAVLEAITRCAKLGAKNAVVGSCQQFYYNIGFRPYLTSTCWKKKN